MRSRNPKHRPTGFILILFLVVFSHGAFATDGKSDDDSEIFVPAERPFDAVNIFGDFGRSIRPSNTLESKIWWERIIRGEVGKDRFLILCALKDGNWKRLGDIRDYIEFQIRTTYSATNLQDMLVLMVGRLNMENSQFAAARPKVREGWLERNHNALSTGIESQWRIDPGVYPLLYFLLMSCPEENRCE